MDQSLRTVATQLLNVSQPEEMVGIKETSKTDSKLGLLIRKPERIIPPSRDETYHNNEKSGAELVKEINSGIGSADSIGLSFGRPINSKYNFVEVSHPGHAMALTEDELEKELSETRLTTPHKNHPTTTGGISTWVLLNPPQTTPNPPGSKVEKEDVKNPLNTEFDNAAVETTMQTQKSTFSPVKIDQATTVAAQKVSTIQTTPKVISKKTTTTRTEKTSSVDSVTTPRSELHSSNSVTVPLSSTTTTTTTRSTSSSDDNQDSLSTTKTSTKKTASTSRSTVKPKTTTPKSTTVVPKVTTMKVVRPGQSNRSPKPTSPRKPSNKNDVPKSPTLSVVNSTSKIEKVTFKPVQMITTPKSHVESVPKPTFATKVQANIQTDVNSKPQQSSKDSQLVAESSPKKGDATSSASTSHSKSKAPKPTNALKVQLKKPIADTPTTIEIEPIKVNAPVLHIEKVEEKKKTSHDSKDSIEPLDNSQIDVKFEFNPEVTKVETSSETPTSTTKKPKGSSKRKKHKHRRRNPSSGSSSSSATTSTTLSSATSMLQEIAETLMPSSSTEQNDNSLQESKVVPDSKVPSNKNKKKQAVKPIGTQIYNYLSREVMPSFGVMSLVGLGLGLASYFLYPFGGAISRRNYEVDPNYKYNIDEYGGNYGQKEEEVFSKVLQGMTPNDGKYGGIKDYEQNHNRYQAYDGAYGSPDTYTTKRNDPKYSSSVLPNYRPDNVPLPYNVKFRNTELRYPDGPTTSNYYDHQDRNTGFLANQGHLNMEVPNVGNPNGDRQFVVGNVPKEYPQENRKKSPAITTESIQTDFEKQIAQGMDFPQNPLDNSQRIGQPDAQPLRAEGFDEIEITPSAVAVEHGPRSLNLEKLEASSAENIAVNNNEELKKRTKRDSVIQLIPTRTEIEKEEREEDLSNEILDIIDTALPNDIGGTKKKKIGVDDPLVKIEKPDVKVDIEKVPTTVKPREELTTSSTSIVSRAKETEVEEKNGVTNNEVTTLKGNPLSSSSSSSPPITTFSTSSNTSKTNNPNVDVASNSESTTFGTISQKPTEEGFSAFNFVKKVAEIKFRLGLTILKHASESFAKYLGQVQKRINGE